MIDTFRGPDNKDYSLIKTLRGYRIFSDLPDGDKQKTLWAHKDLEKSLSYFRGLKVRLFKRHANRNLKNFYNYGSY